MRQAFKSVGNSSAVLPQLHSVLMRQLAEGEIQLLEKVEMSCGFFCTSLSLPQRDAILFALLAQKTFCDCTCIEICAVYLFNWLFPLDMIL
jgi:hypothetical protein